MQYSCVVWLGGHSGIEIWFPWSSRICLCVPFFLLLWESSWAQAWSRHTFLSAFIFCFPSSCFSFFPVSSTGIYDCRKWWLNFKISDMLVFPRGRRSSNYHIITKGKTHHQDILDSVATTTVARGWCHFADCSSSVLWRTGQAAQSMLKGGDRGAVQPSAFTAWEGTQTLHPRFYSSLVLLNLSKAVKILFSYSSFIYQFMCYSWSYFNQATQRELEFKIQRPWKQTVPGAKEPNFGWVFSSTLGGLW